MGKPSGPILLFTVLYIIGIVIGYRNRKEAGYSLFLWCPYFFSYLLYWQFTLF